MRLRVIDENGELVNGVVVKKGLQPVGITDIDGEVDIPYGQYTLYAFGTEKQIFFESDDQVVEFTSQYSPFDVTVEADRTYKKLWSLAALVLLVIIWRKYK